MNVSTDKYFCEIKIQVPYWQAFYGFGDAPEDAGDHSGEGDVSCYEWYSAGDDIVNAILPLLQPGATIL